MRTADAKAGDGTGCRRAFKDAGEPVARCEPLLKRSVQAMNPLAAAVNPEGSGAPFRLAASIPLRCPRARKHLPNRVLSQLFAGRRSVTMWP